MSIHDRYHKGCAYLSKKLFPGQDIEIGVNSIGQLYTIRTVGTSPWGERKREQTYLYKFDIKPSDRGHWHRVRLFLEWLSQALPYGSRDWARATYKELRKWHHETRRREWDQVLPKPIVKWAWSELRKAMDGLDCCDNERVALCGNTGQMRRYRSARAAGCCGFSDFKAKGPDGKTYLLGFNFGH